MATLLYFPVPAFYKAFTKKSAGKLHPLLDAILLCDIGRRLKKDDRNSDNIDEYLCEYYGEPLSSFRRLARIYAPDGHFYDECRAVYSRYSKKDSAPYASISPHLLRQAYDAIDYKTDFARITFIAYLALKSIVGSSSARYVKWELLLCRMAGNVGIVPVDELPEMIQRYSTRKLKDKLRNALIKDYKVQYYFKGRCPWYSFKRPPFSLKDWVDSRRKPEKGTPAQDSTPKKT